MKLISWNVGGIQSRVDDGTLNEIFDLKPDIFCIQELKQKSETFNEKAYCIEGYNSFFYPTSSETGNWGVATYTKYEPITLKEGIGNYEYDVEARIQRIEFEEFELFNVYFPSEARKGLDYKCKFYDLFTEYVRKSKKPQVICGDFNRIYTLNDTYHESYSGQGFKKQDKIWFKEFLDSGFIDSFRLFNKKTGNYTCWSRGKNFKKENKGFRFDYFLVNEELKDNVVNATILHQIPTKDHAPISLELEF